MGLLAPLLQHVQRRIQGIAGSAPHDLPAEDPLKVAPVRKGAHIHPVQEHAVHQHGQVAHAPGHEGAFLPAEVQEFSTGLPERKALLLQALVADAREAGDAAVHAGIMDGLEIKLQFVDDPEGLIQLHGSQLDQLAGQVHRLLHHEAPVRRLVPLQVEDHILHRCIPLFLPL